MIEHTGSTSKRQTWTTREKQTQARTMKDERTFFLRLVPYVGEVSPRHEAATKTSASSQTAPEAREGKEETSA